MSTLSRREFCLGTGAFAAALLAGAPRPSRAARRPALPIPAELRPDSGGAIRLVAEAGRQSFLEGVTTPVSSTASTRSPWRPGTWAT